VSARELGDWLRDMVHYAETAIRLVGTMTLAELQADERTSLALERSIEILGEAAGRVPANGARGIPTCRGGR
jgi:uncharacterized protein with HEPN domain